MGLLHVFVTVAFLLWEVDLKAVEHTRGSLSIASNQKRHYVPLIDDQPIFIPEEFAEPSEDLELEEAAIDDSKNEVKFDNSGVPALEIDQVFQVDERKALKQKPSYIEDTQKPSKDNEDNKHETKDKPYKRVKICVRTNKTKEESNEERNLIEDEPEIATGSHGSGDMGVFDENLSLQEEVKTMFGPSFKSFVFNPSAAPRSKFQECKTSKNETGVCRYVQHCFLPSIVSSVQLFMNNMCIIENRFIGVCCPEFPVQAVSVSWKDGQQKLDDQETFDDSIKTPEECGVGTNTRIVGGSDANAKAYPWMVALLNDKKNFFCGGALINNRYVLTAAHCTFGVKNNEIIARVGDFDLRSDQGEDYRVVEMKRHGQYNRFTLRNDVALLKLEKPVVFNEFVKTVCFPDPTKNYTGKIATLAGWGRLQGGISPLTSDVLQEVEFPIVKNEECEAAHGITIPESLICTSSPSKDKSACNGDSGGPLMMLDDENRWKVVGIVSWGRRGCNTKFPSVFTRVTHYMDWIKQHTS